MLGLGFCVAISEHVAWAGAAIATLLLVLLLVAIRNAWDLVISIAPMAPRTSAAQPAQAPPGA